MTSLPADALVELRDLRVAYKSSHGFLSRRKTEIVAVDDVSLRVERGRTLGIVGATGSGKSTIAQVIMGMVAPTEGSVWIGGRPVGGPTGKRLVTGLEHVRQVVLQDPYSSLDPRMTVSQIIAEPLTLGRPTRSARKRREIAERVVELLGMVGLGPEKAQLHPHQFSGGQRQRIAIARALAPRPDLIVLDEPTSALDVSVRAQILILLRRLQAELGVTYVVISHDLVTVAYLASDVAVMHLGRIVELGPVHELYESPRHPYTLELIASAPGASGSFLKLARPSQPLESLPTSACRYAYRCTLRTRLGDPSRCLDEDPELQPIGPAHSARCHFLEAAVDLAQDVLAPVNNPASAP